MSSRVARAHRALALLFLALAALVQFLLAGLAAFGHGGMDAHVTIGRLLTAIAVVLVVLAIARRREALPATIALLGLMLLQQALGAAGDSVAFMAALHPINGLLILAAAMLAAAGRPIAAGHRHTQRA
jgi:hypothetical protein